VFRGPKKSKIARKKVSKRQMKRRASRVCRLQKIPNNSVTHHGGGRGKGKEGLNPSFISEKKQKGPKRNVNVVEGKTEAEELHARWAQGRQLRV